MKIATLIMCIAICICVAAIIISIIQTKKAAAAYKQYQESIKSKRKIEEQIAFLNDQLEETKELESQANIQKDIARHDFEIIKEATQKMREEADQSVQAYYDKAFEKMQFELDASAQKEAEKYHQAIERFKEEYFRTQEEAAKEMGRYGDAARQLLATIKDMQDKMRAMIEARKRDMENIDKINFYRIQISDSDLLEIQKLKEILPYLRDKDTLNKVIYKIYYENPTNDLIGRVVGKKQGGIYKITNINNGMCYVGQAVNFANRWKQHIKRGVGAEPITHNKLYPAMQKDGVENFTFEIIEECPQNLLNEREDYWQDYFGAKEFGYSIK